MRKIILALVIFSFYSFAPSKEHLRLRDLFYEASEDDSSSSRLFKSMKNVSENSLAINMGFKGMSYLLEAKHSYNPYTKLAYFYKGKDLLEAAIKKSPSNIELRFFRYIIQGNTPAFLGYKSNMKEDQQLINSTLPKSGDLDLKKRIEQYFKDEKNGKWKKE